MRSLLDGRYDPAVGAGALLPSRELAIGRRVVIAAASDREVLVAVVEGPVPGSVVFDLDGRRAVNTEREAPFGMMTKGSDMEFPAGGRA